MPIVLFFIFIHFQLMHDNIFVAKTKSSCLFIIVKLMSPDGLLFFGRNATENVSIRIAFSTVF